MDIKIPFMNIKPPNLHHFADIFQKTITSGQYTNFGLNEQELTKLLEAKIGYPVICTANATLILDGLHHILDECGAIAYLPGFTFPATNLGCRAAYTFGETQTTGELLGFSKFDISTKYMSYCITTAPFGASKPKNYTRPETTYWIVDNAAGTSPEMEKVKEWLDAGADAVVCSLHATKILSGCEGGFVAFNTKYLYDMYRKYIVFGFYLDPKNKKTMINIGSNHKMSEITAAYVLAYYEDIFKYEYNDRCMLVDRYKDFFNSRDIEYITSPQAFWIKCKGSTSLIERDLLFYGIETKPYYQPLFDWYNIDTGSKLLSQQGLCLPTWGMDEEQINYMLDHLKLVTF